MSFFIDTSKIILQPVKVTFLEMHERKEMPPEMPNTFFKLLQKPISGNEYRELYYEVGEKWFWLDRMVMPDETLFEKINATNTDIFVFKVNDKPAG